MQADRARAVFMELVADVPPDQWEARLAECAGEDQPLRLKVASLLAAHLQPGTSFERPAAPLPGTEEGPASGPAAVPPPASVEQAGALLAGRYKLVEQIGEG